MFCFHVYQVFLLIHFESFRHSVIYFLPFLFFFFVTAIFCLFSFFLFILCSHIHFFPQTIWLCPVQIAHQVQRYSFICAYMCLPRQGCADVFRYSMNYAVSIYAKTSNYYVIKPAFSSARIDDLLQPFSLKVDRNI